MWVTPRAGSEPTKSHRIVNPMRLLASREIWMHLRQDRPKQRATRYEGGRKYRRQRRSASQSRSSPSQSTHRVDALFPGKKVRNHYLGRRMLPCRQLFLNLLCKGVGRLVTAVECCVELLRGPRFGSARSGGQGEPC